MKCIYCDKDYYQNSSIIHSLFSNDPMCESCRKLLVKDKRKLKINDFVVESFYLYEDNFKDLILQFKECYDEALKDVFFYEYREYLALKYQGYTMVSVPSTKRKLNERGFNHMELMLESINLKYLDCLKMKEEISQVNKSYKDREKMIGNIYLDTDIKLNKVLLIDDVFTSGSSIYSSYLALRGKVSIIKGVTLAHTKLQIY